MRTQSDAPAESARPDGEPGPDGPVAAGLSGVQALSRIAAELDATAARRDEQRLAERLAEGRAYVACVGQFKRGKSTLLNALVGHAVLPVGVVPVTAVVTVLRHGPRVAARIREKDGTWRDVDPSALVHFVAEERNPANRLGVEAAEVFVPSPLLAGGLCLVDTPGIGSVVAANTAATREFLPHVDAALVVLGADPPISGGELALVSEVAARVPDIVFVLNKADRLAPHEVAQARVFTERVLSERLERAVEVLEVSAAEWLADTGPPRDCDALLSRLEGLAGPARARLLGAAEARGVARLAQRLSRDLEERRAALLAPLEQTQRKVEELRRVVAKAELALRDLSALLSSETKRIRGQFEDERRAFVEREVAAAVDEVFGGIGETEGLGRGAQRRLVVERARAVAETRVRAFLRDAEPRAEDLLRQAATRFVEAANAFLARLASTVAPADLPEEIDLDAALRGRRRFYFADLHVLEPDTPLARVLDVVKSRGRFDAALRRDAVAFLRELLDMNATRVTNDVDERLAESRRAIESEIRGLLDGLVRSATRALDDARRLREEGADAVAAELAHLDEIDRRIAAARTAPHDRRQG